ncbi:hypothetical protein PCE1_000075 [Barthelona sp. PCE]
MIHQLCHIGDSSIALKGYETGSTSHSALGLVESLKGAYIGGNPEFSHYLSCFMNCSAKEDYGLIKNAGFYSFCEEFCDMWFDVYVDKDTYAILDNVFMDLEGLRVFLNVLTLFSHMEDECMHGFLMRHIESILRIDFGLLYDVEIPLTCILTFSDAIVLEDYLSYDLIDSMPPLCFQMIMSLTGLVIGCSVSYDGLRSLFCFNKCKTGIVQLPQKTMLEKSRIEMKNLRFVSRFKRKLLKLFNAFSPLILYIEESLYADCAAIVDMTWDNVLFSTKDIGGITDFLHGADATDFAMLSNAVPFLGQVATVISEVLRLEHKFFLQNDILQGFNRFFYYLRTSAVLRVIESNKEPDNLAKTLATLLNEIFTEYIKLFTNILSHYPSMSSLLRTSRSFSVYSNQLFTPLSFLMALFRDPEMTFFQSAAASSFAMSLPYLDKDLIAQIPTLYPKAFKSIMETCFLNYKNAGSGHYDILAVLLYGAHSNIEHFNRVRKQLNITTDTICNVFYFKGVEAHLLFRSLLNNDVPTDFLMSYVTKFLQIFSTEFNLSVGDLIGLCDTLLIIICQYLEVTCTESILSSKVCREAVLKCTHIALQAHSYTSTFHRVSFPKAVLDRYGVSTYRTYLCMLRDLKNMIMIS